MAFLLDTNIVSELGRKDRCEPKVKKWALAHRTERQFISVITLGEIRNGVELKRLKQPNEAVILESKLERLIEEFEGSILLVTHEVADRWGRMNCPETLPTADSLIAATALVNGLTLVTRNVKDFKRMGIKMINPFE